jgi:hypothetical protein
MAVGRLVKVGARSAPYQGTFLSAERNVLNPKSSRRLEK